MTFEVGKVLEDSQWQAPVYCFKKAEEEKTSLVQSMADLVPSGGGLVRGPINTSLQL